MPARLKWFLGEKETAWLANYRPSLAANEPAGTRPLDRTRAIRGSGEDGFDDVAASRGAPKQFGHGKAGGMKHAGQTSGLDLG